MKEGNERTFLHDIASPIGIALYQVDALLDCMQAKPGVDPEQLMLAVQIFEALERAKKMLQERREILIKMGVPSERAK